MPLQNRVTPDGQILSHTALGLFMGNRGIMHGDHQYLGRSRWKHPHWIICLTGFRDRHRVVMTPHRYTELFFLDDAVALAAGHRPCAECRRADFNCFLEAVASVFDGQRPKAAELDRQLHEERVSVQRRQQTSRLPLVDLPDGVMLRHPATPADIRLLQNGKLLKWQMDGYLDDGVTAAEPDENDIVVVLTPPTSIRALQGGYGPVLYPVPGPA